MTPIDDDPPERTDDLAEALSRAAPRRWWDRGTLVLGALVLVVAGFLGGALTQKQWGTGTTSTVTRPANVGNPGRFAGGANPPGATPTPSATDTTGTVKLVDGGTIYLQTADGTVVTVRTDAKTSVRSAKPAAVKDVKAGDTVTVRGSTGTDGTLAASAVTTVQK